MADEVRLAPKAFGATIRWHRLIQDRMRSFLAKPRQTHPHEVIPLVRDFAFQARLDGRQRSTQWTVFSSVRMATTTFAALGAAQASAD
jgi:hypothetical protein